MDALRTEDDIGIPGYSAPMPRAKKRTSLMLSVGCIGGAYVCRVYDGIRGMTADTAYATRAKAIEGSMRLVCDFWKKHG